MPLSNSNLRRYTPPTCTLEIAAKTSPLSRFVGQSVLKNLRFELRFDDPRQPDDQRVTIRGDQIELEMLCEAVNSYIQHFLESSSTQELLISGTPRAGSGSTPHDNLSQDSLASPASSVINSDAIASRSLYSEPGKLDDSALSPNLQRKPKRRSLKARSLATDIYLEPKGLLAHNLILGHLGTEESGPFVNLSVTQLFDLATALDEYAVEAVALPTLNVLSWKKSPPAWAGTAAAVVLAVGVTAATVKYFDQPKKQPVATTAGQQPSPTPPPTPATPVPTAPITLLPTPTVPSPLSTAPILPPPSRVNIPSTPSPLNLPLGNQGSTNSSLANQRPTTIIGVNPSEPATNRPNRSDIPVFTDGSATRPSSIPPSPTVAISKRNPSPSAPAAGKAPPEPAPTRTTKPGIPETAPSLPNLPSLNPSPSKASNSDNSSIPPATSRTASPTAETNQSASVPTDTGDKNTLFDRIPQVGEVRDYLQQRWKPPSGLTQILEYYVFLNPNGTVERIIPINSAAVENLNRTNIPTPGESFVSAVQGEGNPKIRVVFNPDGKVQTFYEGRER
jgi:hypothetical protein